MNPLAIFHVLLYTTVSANCWSFLAGFFESPRAIISAAEKGHVKRLRGLLETSALDPAAYTDLALRMAARNGRVQCLKLLLADSRVNPAACNNFAIRWAAYHGRSRCVKLLLANPLVDPAADNNDAIRWAARNGHAKCVGLLLADLRVDPTANDDQAIRWAAENGHAECVQLLLANMRVNPAADNDYAVRSAAVANRVGCLKLLLADPRVNPSAIQSNLCHPFVRSLVQSVQACKDGDLEAFKEISPSALSNDALDIFISRNQPFPEVQRLLLPAWLTRLNIPETVRNDPVYNNLLHLAIPRGLCSPGQVRELTRTFIGVKNRTGLPIELAANIAAHVYGLVP